VIILKLVSIFLSAYLIGAVPFSFIIGKICGKDIRREGSGNIGATNVMRCCGKTAGMFAYITDIGKGIIAVMCVYSAAGHLGLNANHGGIAAGLLAACFMPVLGHVYPVFLKFKGGKGVAVSAGILVYILPIPLLLSLVVFFIVFAITKIISISSVSASLTLPPVILLHHIFIKKQIGPPWLRYQSSAEANVFYLLLALTTALAVFLVFHHRENIKRLINGNELSFRNKID